MPLYALFINLGKDFWYRVYREALASTPKIWVQEKFIKLTVFLHDEMQAYENFVQCKNLAYLGSAILNSAKLGKEFMYKISKAKEEWQERLWNNHHVFFKVKCKVYSPTVWIRDLGKTSVPCKEAAWFLMKQIMNLTW